MRRHITQNLANRSLVICRVRFVHLIDLRVGLRLSSRAQRLLYKISSLAQNALLFN